MTTPAQPDTGAGAAPDTGSAPQDPTATEAETQDTPETGEPDWKAEAEKWKAQARKHEDRAKANKAALDKAARQAAPKDGEPTVEDLQKQLTEANEAREAAETAAVEAAYTSTVTRVAAQVGADAEALLDSDSFRDAVREQLDEDGFDDDDLKAAVTKAAKEFAKKPRFALAGGATRGGADLGAAGAPPPAKPRPRSLSEAVRQYRG
jgi:hypothetical protein